MNIVLLCLVLWYLYDQLQLIYDAPNPWTWMLLFSSCNWLCPIHISRVLIREWRCSWSSADRWCSNYIWVINNFIAYWDASLIRCFTVEMKLHAQYSSIHLKNSTTIWQLRQPRIWCCHYLPPGSLLTLGASESLSYSHVSFNLI